MENKPQFSSIIENEQEMFLSEPLPENCNLLFSISIGQPMQTGERFTRMVECLIKNEAHIQSLTFFNTSYLQRFHKYIDLLPLTAQNKLSEDEAKTLSVNASVELLNDWLGENEDAFKLLQKNFRHFHILDWQTLLENNAYTVMAKNIYTYYNESKAFRNALDGLNKIFFSKMSVKIKDSVPKELIMNQFYNFVLEECAVRSLLEFDVEIYPGMPNIPAVLCYKMFGLGKEKHKMKVTSIGTSLELQRYLLKASKNKKINFHYNDACGLSIKIEAPQGIVSTLTEGTFSDLSNQYAKNILSLLSIQQKKIEEESI